MPDQDSNLFWLEIMYIHEKYGFSFFAVTNQ